MAAACVVHGCCLCGRQLVYQVCGLIPMLVRKIYTNKGSKTNNFTFTPAGKATIKMSFADGDARCCACVSCAKLFDYSIPILKAQCERYKVDQVELRAAEIAAARYEQMRNTLVQRELAERQKAEKVDELQRRKQVAKRQRKADLKAQKMQQQVAVQMQQQLDLEQRELRREAARSRDAVRHQTFQQFLRSHKDIAGAHTDLPACA